MPLHDTIQQKGGADNSWGLLIVNETPNILERHHSFMALLWRCFVKLSDLLIIEIGLEKHFLGICSPFVASFPFSLLLIPASLGLYSQKNMLP